MFSQAQIILSPCGTVLAYLLYVCVYVSVFRHQAELALFHLVAAATQRCRWFPSDGKDLSLDVRSLCLCCCSTLPVYVGQFFWQKQKKAPTYIHTEAFLCVCVLCFQAKRFMLPNNAQRQTFTITCGRAFNSNRHRNGEWKKSPKQQLCFCPCLQHKTGGMAVVRVGPLERAHKRHTVWFLVRPNL